MDCVIHNSDEKLTATNKHWNVINLNCRLNELNGYEIKRDRKRTREEKNKSQFSCGSKCLGGLNVAAVFVLFIVFTIAIYAVDSIK